MGLALHLSQSVELNIAVITKKKTQGEDIAPESFGTHERSAHA